MIVVGNTADSPLPRSNHPVTLAKRRPSVPLSAVDRRLALRTARLFVATAVRRQHTERAWVLSSPSLRNGTTYADWQAGSIPVPPYPVLSARWKQAYSVAGEVGFDVFVEPTDASVQALAYRLTLVRERKTSTTRRWLVNAWTPLQAAGGLAAATEGDAYVDSPRASVRASEIWILIPFAVLGVGLLVALVVWLAGVAPRSGSRKPKRLV